MIILQALAVGAYSFIVLMGFILALVVAISLLCLIVRAIRGAGKFDERDI